jgi:hypothetical protein
MHQCLTKQTNKKKVRGKKVYNKLLLYGAVHSGMSYQYISSRNKNIIKTKNITKNEET